jgi:hypothetical protein
MADRRVPWARVLAFAVALVMVLGSAAFLVVSLREREDARSELATARVALRHERAVSTTSAIDLTVAHRELGTLQQQLTAVGPSAAAIAKLDQQDLESVRAALHAGLAGDLDAYNQAVEQRGAIVPEPDAALEQLRQQANAIITALDQVRD